MNFAKLYDAGRVQRFHTTPDYTGGAKQNIADHSWGVALVLLELYRRAEKEPTVNVLRAAILHDTEELIVGDVAATAKWRFPALSAALLTAEEDARTELGTASLPVLTAEESVFLRWADSLELAAYCKRRSGGDGRCPYFLIYTNVINFLSNYAPKLPIGRDFLMEMIAS
jgi:5'-deoxynucleotidase YfbR-like HD superfamily hydrolase